MDAYDHRKKSFSFVLRVVSGIRSEWNLARLWLAQMRHGARPAIFPRISKAPFSEQHRLLVCSSCFVRFAPSLVIQPEAKVFSPQFLVKSAFADSIIHFRISLTNVFELS